MNIAARLLCVSPLVVLAACSSADTDGEIDSRYSTSFDGEVLRLEFEREDGGTERFSTLRDNWFDRTWVPFLPNHSGRRWALAKTGVEGTSIAYALVRLGQ